MNGLPVMNIHRHLIIFTEEIINELAIKIRRIDCKIETMRKVILHNLSITGNISNNTLSFHPWKFIATRPGLRQ